MKKILILIFITMRLLTPPGKRMLKINDTSKFSKNNNDPKKPNVSLDKYMLSLKLDESNASNPGG